MDQAKCDAKQTFRVTLMFPLPWVTTELIVARTKLFGTWMYAAGGWGLLP
ncbi:MAG: hypothetical protein ACK2UW_10435 [Anaerolineales bacterium]